MNVIDAIRAVQAVEDYKKQGALDAKKRKLPEWEVYTFFGKNDMWKYIEISDDRLCPDCRFYATKLIFFGDALRAFFPYLEIMDENTIRVNVHPNCRCILVRFEAEEVNMNGF